MTAELDGLVREQPLRERLHAQLMLALYRSGRQADALAAYRRARDFAGFCDHQVDQLAGKALATQETNPAAARKLWAQVDRRVTDQAPWAPILNLRDSVFVSARVGNYQDFPYYDGPLLDQIWVQ